MRETLHRNNVFLKYYKNAYYDDDDESDFLKYVRGKHKPQQITFII